MKAEDARSLDRRNKRLLKKFKDAREVLGFGVLGIVLFLLIWSLAVRFTRIGMLVPGPAEVGSFFIESFQVNIGKFTMLGHTAISLTRVMVGYVAGIILGVVCGIGMGVSKMFKAIFRPLFELLRPIPTIAWIPIAILFFGTGEMTKYFIIFYGAFITVTLNTYSGVMQVDPILIGAARMLGAKDNQMLFKVIIPSSLPWIMAGMQVGLANGWMGVIAAEMVKSREGLGWLILMGQASGSMTQILGGMVSIAIIGLLLATAMRALEKGLCRWNTRSN
jgi:NitT/TauT family transport system permease protein/sulfonate transport system permease protein